MSADEIARGTAQELLLRLPDSEVLRSLVDGQTQSSTDWLLDARKLSEPDETWVLWKSTYDYGRWWRYSLGPPGMSILVGVKGRPRRQRPRLKKIP